MMPARLLVMADASPFNDWLLSVLQHEIALCGVIRPTWESSPTPAASAPARAPTSLGRALRRRVRARYFAPLDAYEAEQLRERLADRAPVVSPSAPIWSVPTHEINAERTIALVQAAEPALMLLSGAPLVRAPLYTAPPFGTLNLHLGIAPDYRGLHTLRVPWQDRDYARIGLTVHQVTDGIDAGAIVLRAYPEVRPDDALVDLEARLARIAARELVALWRWWLAQPTRRPIPGRVVDDPGRLVRFHDRRIRDDLTCRLAHRFGRRAPALPERVERCYLEREAPTAN